MFNFRKLFIKKPKKDDSFLSSDDIKINNPNYNDDLYNAVKDFFRQDSVLKYYDNICQYELSSITKMLLRLKQIEDWLKTNTIDEKIKYAYNKNIDNYKIEINKRLDFLGKRAKKEELYNSIPKPLSYDDCLLQPMRDRVLYTLRADATKFDGS